MARQVRFSAIPNIPQDTGQLWQYTVLTAIKEDIELLIGARGSGDARAVLKGHITAPNPPAQQMQQVSATGAGVAVGGYSVPTAEDYAKLIRDVQTMASDVAALRATVALVMNQLKA